MPIKVTQSDILNRFIEKHGSLYDYSNVVYNKMRDKVSIKCKIHNIIFMQSPMKHLESKTGGCPKCNSIGKGRLTNCLFIEKSKAIHDDLYDYSLCDYSYSNKKVKIFCYKHGIFEITPNSHLNGRGCRKCGGNYKYTKNDLLEIYNSLYNNYTYDFKNYINIKSRILVKCSNHSYFETSAELLLNGYGCSSCSKKSKGEEKISQYLLKNNKIYYKQKSFNACESKNKLLFDFFLPEDNICVEYDGIQHFQPVSYFGGLYAFKYQKIKDAIKNKFCEDNNIKLIRIPYYNYDDIDKILDMLL